MEQQQVPSAEPAPRGSARQIGTIVLLGAVFAIVLLSVGVSVALIILHDLRGEVAEIRAAVQAMPPGGRPTVPPPPAIPTEPVPLTGAQLKGNETAKVAVLMFSDFQCPFCARFARSAYADLTRDYVDTGQVLLAFRHLPLDQIHPNARPAAEAAECAGRQGQFWEMHDRLFLDPSRLGRSDLQEHATSLGLGQGDFERCLAGEVAAKVREDVTEAGRLQVYGTPAFLVGTLQPDGRMKVTERFSGAQQIGTFRTVLDRLLAAGDN